MTTQLDGAIVLTEETVADYIGQIATLEEMAKDARDAAGKLRMQVSQWMRANEAQSFPHATCDVTQKPGAPFYPVDRVRATLGELLTAPDLESLIPTPGPCKDCEGTGKAPVRVDGNQAKRIRKYGGEYAEKLDQACLRADPVLTIKRKVTTQ